MNKTHMHNLLWHTITLLATDLRLPDQWTDGSASLLAAALVLLMNTCTDLKTRQISFPVTGIGALFGLMQCIALRRAPADVLASLFPGLVLILFSIVTKGSIGLGDGIVIAALGLLLPSFSVLLLVTIAFGLTAIPSGILFVKRRGKNASLPFVPFLFAAYALMLVI